VLYPGWGRLGGGRMVILRGIIAIHVGSWNDVESYFLQPAPFGWLDDAGEKIKTDRLMIRFAYHKSLSYLFFRNVPLSIS
jgi:hypothetical protein